MSEINQVKNDEEDEQRQGEGNGVDDGENENRCVSERERARDPWWSRGVGRWEGQGHVVLPCTGGGGAVASAPAGL